MANNEVANLLIQSAVDIENQIMRYCSIKPEDINDDSISAYLEDLKSFNIT